MIWRTERSKLVLEEEGLIMGILNTTPDSFSDGGRYETLDSALSHARQMIADGVGIIDVGGESTRPGAVGVSTEEEIQRTEPLIAAIREIWDGMISIDTQKADVAAAALRAGADIVNDVSGLRADKRMAQICADLGCGVVIMHMRGEPGTMQQAPVYTDVVQEVADFFLKRQEDLISKGIDPQCLVYDPGIGFGKTFEHNMALLAGVEFLAPPGRPLMLGVSRKSFLQKISGAECPEARDAPTHAITVLTRGVNILLHRVHDVAGNMAALRAAEALLSARRPEHLALGEVDS